ncbi:MAG: outer membrane protein transport protein [Pseudomonadales bacterium]|nr:outer membrane protein transport protein [Pseudomonadales bacterium]
MHLRSDRPGRLVYKIYVFFIVLLANVSHAQLAQNLTIGSAKAVSLANAVTADPTGIDSIHFNPAGLHQVKDRQYQLKLIGGHFSISGDIQRSDRYKREMEINGYNYDDDPVEEGESSTQDVSVMLPVVGMTDIPVLLAPLGGASVELVDDGVVFGTSVFAPMIVGYDRGEDSPLRYQGVKLGLTHLTYFSPTVAFKVTETFTMGLGVHLNYTGVAIDLDFRLPNAVLFAVDDLSTLVCGTPLFDDLINLCEGDLGPFTDIGAIEIEVEDILILLLMSVFCGSLRLGFPGEWSTKVVRKQH